MPTALIKRLSLLIGIMLGAVLVVHTLIYLIPGDPAIMIAGDYANPEDIRAIRNELALNDPFFIRYLHYLKRLSVLDMGKSVYTGAPVTEILWERFPATLALAVIAMIIAGITGITFGIISAVWKGRAADYLILWSSSVFISTPIFVTCFVLSLVFSYYLNLLPPSGKQGMNPLYIILPALALGSRSIALIVRVVRNELLEVLRTNYIKAARSLGFHETRIILVFALKNIIAPVFTIILLDFGAYLGGAVVTETIFSWPGIGRLLIIALHKRDIPVVQGVILLGTFLFLAIGIAIEILQGVLSKNSRENAPA